ncbi:Rpn family recombination-promoting nuclease/putative transposase [Archangium sp.]|uniref:Rpn family recombination-promoting nuclease/putative transposase n=1 Tax=Archangium sp. TaxID=1872627 RepID=UPI00286D6117|nr:Rpn family recombination-promoting nuclease/putative transposase [Archangium sp.]
MSGPHDLFVRSTFGHPERAAAELRVALPSHVVAEVDWETLRAEPGSVVDPELRETESDLLFSARLRSGRPLLLYVLLEHQSSVDPWMAWRMLRYVVRLGEQWRQEHPERTRLPVIIPLVMFHGTGEAWTAPRRVEELFDLPDEEEARERWQALVPRFEYLLDDLTAEREEALRARPGPPLVQLAWLLLRYGRTEELAERLLEWMALFVQVRAAPEGAEHLGMVIRYLLYIGDSTAREATRRVLHSVVDAQRTEELMRSYGEELIEQGRQQGLQQGQAKGHAESVLRLLAARGVPVTEEARQRILTCTDLATLDRWFDRALTASTLSDVLAEPAQ